MVDNPYLTVIFTGRNDGHGGDFNGRFFRALEFDHWRLRDAGVSHNFIFVEWRPVPGKPYLSTLLADRFRGVLDQCLTCLVVDPAYHDALSLNPKLQFLEFIAKNVGIRRATGRFILTTNTDIYLGREVLRTVAARRLRDAVLYRAVRIDLKTACDLDGIDWDVLEDPRNHQFVNTLKPPLYSNASGDFLLLDRDTYHRLRGFNEVYRIANLHLDRNFCAKAYAAGVPLENLDAPIYHMGAGTNNSQVREVRTEGEPGPRVDRRWKKDLVCHNGDEWGLVNAPTRRLDDTTCYLDFSWSAVAPIVDLKRVGSASALRESEP